MQGISTASIDAFRLATESDSLAIAALVNSAYRPETGSPGWTNESALVSGPRTQAADVIALINAKDSVILVGITDDRIVACANVVRDGTGCHIGMLAVLPTLQGSGAGKLMLAQAEHLARTRFGAVRFVMQVVSARADLIAFYLRRGYQRTGEVMPYPVNTGVGIPKRDDLKLETLTKSAKVGT